MLKTFLLSLFCLTFLFSQAFSQENFSQKVQDLLKKAKEHNPNRYQFALDNGAKIYQTADQKSFYLLWFPPKSDKKTLIVTMHGSNSYAFDEFFLWKEDAEKHGHGILALQWYFDGNKPPEDYYLPKEAYENIAPILKDLKIEKGKTMFHGFSRGSANSYYVALFDHQAKNDYFGLILSNSGGASEGYPLYREVVAEKFGKNPFEGINWMTFCGQKDPNPERDGCPAMQRTAKFIEKYGGKVKLAIEFKDGDHGGFHRNSENVEKALDLFDKILKGKS